MSDFLAAVNNAHLVVPKPQAKQEGGEEEEQEGEKRLQSRAAEGVHGVHG